MRIGKLLGGATLLVAAALVGGTLIGSALASPGGGVGVQAGADGHPLRDRDGRYCEAFLDAFANELGVSRDDLLPAGKAATLTAIDAAVEAGDLDEDRAATLRERVEQFDEDGCGLGPRFGFSRGIAAGEARGFLHAEVMEAAAAALDLESADLIDRMADGQSLEEIAAAAGLDYEAVKAEIVAAIEADLDAAVAEGLDQERADAMLERIGAWLDEGGERGSGPGGRFGGPGHGRGDPWH